MTAPTAARPSIRPTDELVAMSLDPELSLPPQVRTRVAQCLLDFLGLAIAGGQQVESSAAVRQAVRANPAWPGKALVLGERETYARDLAVFLNGTYAHSMAFDDTNLTGVVHPGSVIFPIAITLAHEHNLTGSEFLAAAAVGYEICIRIGQALGGSALFRRGFQPTGVAGIFGAVATGGRASGLDFAAVNDAFGLAGSMAAGSMQYESNGAWNKRLHSGLAGRNALFALDLAAARVRGADEALEGANGLLAAYAAEPNVDALTAQLGTEWRLLDTAIKPYPACRAAHSAIAAALQLRQTFRTSRGAARVSVKLPAAAYELVGRPTRLKRAPVQSVDAQYSAYFLVALALLDGKVAWSSYERIGDKDALALAERIAVDCDPAIEGFGAEVSVESEGTDRIVCRVESPPGEPQGGTVDWAPVETKFSSLTESTLGVSRSGRVIELVRSLDECGSMEPLLCALRMRSQ